MTILEKWITISVYNISLIFKEATTFIFNKVDIKKVFFTYVDYRIIIKISIFYHYLLRKKYGKENIFNQTHKNILGTQSKKNYTHNIIQQRILRNALVNGNKKLTTDLLICANKLKTFIANQKIESTPIFAPLHMVSDVVAASLPGLATDKPVTVISVHDEISSKKYTQEHNNLGLSIEQFNPGNLSGDNGSTFTSLINQLMDEKINLVIFPDILPECTLRIAKRKMNTTPIILFGREGSIHNGVNTFSKVLKSRVLFYCLFFNEKQSLDIDILAFPTWRELNNVMPEIIESAINKYSHEWMLWHYSSFFYFNYKH